MDIAATLHRPGWVDLTRAWIFPDTSSTRDPRLDFMRGMVFVLLFVVHFDYFSIFTFLAWERFGVVSSAETFIALAGIVSGLVFGRKLKAEGLGPCLPGLHNIWVNSGIHLGTLLIAWFCVKKQFLFRWVPH